MTPVGIHSPDILEKRGVQAYMCYICRDLYPKNYKIFVPVPEIERSLKMPCPACLGNRSIPQGEIFRAIQNENPEIPLELWEGAIKKQIGK